MSVRRDNFRLAYRNLKAAKGRSFLTMLGIIIGVTAGVLMVSVGQGVKQQIAGQFGRYSKNVLLVQPGSAGSTNSVLTGLIGANSSLLTENDLRVVQKTDTIATAVPLATATGSMQGDHTVQTPFIVATSADFPSVVKQSFLAGGFFDRNVDSKTIVLGQTLAQHIFDNNAPLGQSVTWRGQNFIVAGVFNDFKAPPFSLEADFNNAAFVPYSTAQQLSRNVLGIYQILAKPTATSDVQQTAQRVQAALVSSHGGAHDVSVTQASATHSTPDQTIHLLTLLVAGAAIVALVVGGIGIMDVMLVSVTERMHEIGIRKAIGATNNQIMRQFTAEAFVLSTIGTAIGVVVSLVSIGLLRLYSSLQPIIVWQVLVVAPIIAILIGVFFGCLPALKAARKDPIDALRQE